MWRRLKLSFGPYPGGGKRIMVVAAVNQNLNVQKDRDVDEVRKRQPPIQGSQHRYFDQPRPHLQTPTGAPGGRRPQRQARDQRQERQKRQRQPRVSSKLGSHRAASLQ